MTEGRLKILASCPNSLTGELVHSVIRLVALCPHQDLEAEQALERARIHIEDQLPLLCEWCGRTPVGRDAEPGSVWVHGSAEEIKQLGKDALIPCHVPELQELLYDIERFQRR